MEEVDLIIVGGGVVGLACARATARAGRTVCLLERHPRFGTETSTHNSGVIHAGIYYEKDSLKARLCVKGRDMLYAYCTERGIGHRHCGKLLVASEAAVKQHGLKPMAKIIGMATAGVEPRIMGYGPVPAVQKLLKRTGIAIDDIDVFEFNEAFAAQALACMRDLGLADDDPRVNPNGGAIALGHPLGMSGARLLLTAAHELQNSGKRYALCTMCVGVGQGIATLIERV